MVSNENIARRRAALDGTNPDQLKSRLATVEQDLADQHRISEAIAKERDGMRVQLATMLARLDSMQIALDEARSAPSNVVQGVVIEKFYLAGKTADYMAPDGVGSEHYEAGQAILHAERFPNLKEWVDSGWLLERMRPVKVEA